MNNLQKSLINSLKSIIFFWDKFSSVNDIKKFIIVSRGVIFIIFIFILFDFNSVILYLSL